MPTTRPDQPQFRFEAIVLREAIGEARQIVADLDLDRLPDSKGEVRVLLTAEEAARLLECGYELRLLKAYPIGPLDPSRVMDDKAAQSALEQRIRGLRREGER
jgi:hypothetical protein